MFYGDWKWETPNERVITMLMQEVGMYPFKNEEHMISKTPVSEYLYQKSIKEIPTIPTIQTKGDESKTPEEIMKEMHWTYDADPGLYRLFVYLIKPAMENYAAQFKILNKHDVGRSLPTDEMILNKAKDLALLFENETDDRYASIELTSKDLLWLVEFAKGNVC